MPFTEKARKRRREIQFLQGALTRGLDIEHYVKTGQFRYDKKRKLKPKKTKRGKRK